MSELIQHECGIALIRLKKSLEFFTQKYGTPLYAFNKLFLLMEKQHNRGQDGAGIGAVKLNVPKGRSYMFRERVLQDNSLAKLFRKQLKRYDKLVRRGHVIPEYAPSVKENFDFGAEILMGHLRYGTSGEFNQNACHPYYRQSNWPTRNLMVAGNFNMTNLIELNAKLIQRGQHPIFDTDTQTVLEEIGYHLDEMHQALYHELRDAGVPGPDIPKIISERLDVPTILRKTAQVWDGGYTIAGLIGNGDCFVLRDPHGIRPCHYFEDDEMIAFASERVPLMTVFGVAQEDVKEVTPGHVVAIKHTGEISEEPFIKQQPLRPCSFERIYFSRGNDPEIYAERKKLGGSLVPQVLEAVNYDFDNTVFSFIPNTAEVAFYGLLGELRMNRRRAVNDELLQDFRAGTLTEEKISRLVLNNWPRSEKIAHKDIKLRTFISQEKGRSKLVSHVYDVSYGVVKETDNLVVLDDSIVRGTTLRESIIKILSRTRPKRIIIASTAPQIRYPDCYGIDMSEIGKFVAFQAAVSLLKERGQDTVLREIHEACCAEMDKPIKEQVNQVKRLYEPFSPEEISARISEMLRPRDIEWDGDLQIIFQSIESLHKSIPVHNGDWYFTGDFPTPGGISVCNQAYINYFENKSGRSYDLSSLTV